MEINMMLNALLPKKLNPIMEMNNGTTIEMSVGTIGIPILGISPARDKPL